MILIDTKNGKYEIIGDVLETVAEALSAIVTVLRTMPEGDGCAKRELADACINAINRFMENPQVFDEEARNDSH